MSASSESKREGQSTKANDGSETQWYEIDLGENPGIDDKQTEEEDIETFLEIEKQQLEQVAHKEEPQKQPRKQEGLEIRKETEIEITPSIPQLEVTPAAEEQEFETSEGPAEPMTGPSVRGPSPLSRYVLTVSDFGGGVSTSGDGQGPAPASPTYKGEDDEEAEDEEESTKSDESMVSGSSSVYEDAEEVLYSDSSRIANPAEEDDDDDDDVEGEVNTQSPTSLAITRRQLSHAEKMIYLLFGPPGSHSLSINDSGQMLMPPTFPRQMARHLLDLIPYLSTSNSLQMPPYGGEHQRIIRMSSIQNDPFISTSVLSTAMELWLRENGLTKYCEPEVYVGPRGKRREVERPWFRKAVLNSAVTRWVEDTETDNPLNPYSYHYIGDQEDEDEDDFEDIARVQSRPKLLTQGAITDQTPKAAHADDDDDIILEDDWEERAFAPPVEEEEDDSNDTPDEDDNENKVDAGEDMEVDQPTETADMTIDPELL